MSKRKANEEEYPKKRTLESDITASVEKTIHDYFETLPNIMDVKFKVELDDSHMSHIKNFVRLTASKKIAQLLETDKSLTSLNLEGNFWVHFRG